MGRHPLDSRADEPKHKPLIGIIGGIASGKSTVAREFGKLGCAVIDADQMAHAFLEDSAVRDEVIRLLGPGVIGSDGRIDRRTVGQLVFADRRRLAALNAISSAVSRSLGAKRGAAGRASSAPAGVVFSWPCGRLIDVPLPTIDEARP